MKPTRKIFLFSAVIFVLSVGASIYLMFFGPDQIQTEGKNIAELSDNGALLGIVAVAVSLIIVAVVLVSLYRALNPPEIKNGIEAKAEVLEISDTGTTLNENPQIKLLLKIKKPDGATYEAEVKTLVSRLNAANVRPGCQAEVKYDPANPKRVQLIKLELARAESGVDRFAERLQNLADLRDKRLITDEEYKTRREEILKEL
jgi:hypothetical protein